jgi:hypothetical protein
MVANDKTKYPDRRRDTSRLNKFGRWRQGRTPWRDTPSLKDVDMDACTGARMRRCGPAQRSTNSPIVRCSVRNQWSCSKKIWRGNSHGLMSPLAEDRSRADWYPATTVLVWHLVPILNLLPAFAPSSEIVSSSLVLFRINARVCLSSRPS